MARIAQPGRRRPAPDRTSAPVSGMAAQRIERLEHRAEAVGADVEHAGAGAWRRRRCMHRRDRRRARTDTGSTRRRARSDRRRPRSSRRGCRRCRGVRARGSSGVGRSRRRDPAGPRRDTPTRRRAWRAPYASSGLGTVVGSTGFAVGHAEHGARRRVDDLADARPPGRRRAALGAVDVDRSEQMRGSFASGTWATLWKTRSTPRTARSDDRAVADVTGDELDVGGPVGVGEVEHPHVVTPLEEPIDEQRPEVAAPAGDEAARHSSSPCARHQRMLRRMPVVQRDLGLVAEVGPSGVDRQAMFLFISPSTWICWW